MRLISCYIENFGGLQKFAFDFNAGINIILEENGWGKSTLAAFLKAMFYGMERTTKRSLAENERKKYEPWNGGVYGGNLTFEADEKQYRIERFFGIKDKEDLFALYDVATGLESRDYSESIGEELFGIDRLAFEQSVFMKQGMYAVSMTDSVATKMSGLMASGDDMDCYEKACIRLENEMKVYRKIGNKGKIPELTEEIAVLNRKLAEGKEVGANIAEWEKRKQQCTQDLKDLNENKELLKSRIRKAGEQAAIIEKRKYYNSLKGEKEKLEAELETLKHYFVNGVPTEEQLEECRHKLFLYWQEDEITDVEDDFTYPNIVKVLKEHPITNEEVIVCQGRWEEVQEKKKDLDKMELQLRTMQIREEERKVYIKEKIKTIKIRQNLFLILIVTALITGIVLFFAVNVRVAFIGVAIAMIFAIFAVISVFQKKRLLNEINEQNEEILQLEDICKGLRDDAEQGKKAVFLYLEKFIGPREDVSVCLNKIHVTLAELQSHNEHKRKQELRKENALKEKEMLKEELLIFLREFYSNITRVDEALLKEIEQKRNEYVNLNKQYREKCKQMENAEKVDKIQEELYSMDELQKEELLLEEKISAEESRLRQISRTISQYKELLEECEKIEMEKHDLEEVLAECSVKYKRLERTLKYLKTAQTDFSSRYLNKMNEGFAKYSGMFRQGAFEKTALDVKLVAKSEENGIKREIGYYSIGLKETMELCTRLALIDALFEEEQPFVILDDPFVNLDEKALIGAKEVLAKIAQQYQLIYFTCHPSRQ